MPTPNPLGVRVSDAEVPAADLPLSVGGRDTCARCGEAICEHHDGLWSNPSSDGAE